MCYATFKCTIYIAQWLVSYILNELPMTVTLEGVLLLLEQGEVLMQVRVDFSNCCDRFFTYLISCPHTDTVRRVNYSPHAFYR